MTEPIVVPKRGPGRPRKPTAPRSEAQARLALAVTRAEEALEVASGAYMAARTATNELELRSCELSVASAWAAYLRASGDFTNATRCSSDANKITGDLCRLRELLAVDQLDKLVARSEREDALAGKAGR